MWDGLQPVRKDSTHRRNHDLTVKTEVAWICMLDRRSYRRHLPHYQNGNRIYLITFVTLHRQTLRPEAREIVLNEIGRLTNVSLLCMQRSWCRITSTSSFNLFGMTPASHSHFQWFSECSRDDPRDALIFCRNDRGASGLMNRTITSSVRARALRKKSNTCYRIPFDEESFENPMITSGSGDGGSKADGLKPVPH